MSNLYIILYLLAWLIMLVIFLRKKKRLDIGNVILCSYAMYAALALVLYNMPQPYWEFLPIRLFPFVYLFSMLLLATWPVLRYDFQQATEIVPPNMTIIKSTAWFIIICAILCIPTLVNIGGFDGLSRLLSNSSTGQELYKESTLRAGDAGSGISNLPSIFTNAFSDIAILLLFYFLTLEEKNPILILGLLCTTIITTVSPILNGQRSNVILSVMTFIAAYFLLRNYLTNKIRKWIEIIFAALLCIVAIFVVAVTVSRFEDRDGGAIGSVVYYTGQAPLNFNNYGLDAGGIRYGERTFNLAKRFIDPSTPTNYSERRDKYDHLLMDDYIFYTFVGDFTLDFGPFLAPLIFLLFTVFVLRKTKPTDNKIEFHQLLLLYFVACICMQGGMYLFSYSDTAGLKIIVLLILYYVLKCSVVPKTNVSCQD